MTDSPQPRGAALVECEGLVRIFKREGVEVVALQGLDLTVDPGEVVAIVGASGSGKSTLLSILSALDVPSAGSVRVAGSDLMTMSRSQRVHYRRHTVGFLFQQASHNLLPYLTAAENVALPMTLAGVAAPERASRAEHLLEVVGVPDVADRRMSELSGGQQQRVAIGVALANEPRLLLADEPTGELDTRSGDEVFAAMRAANEHLGTTVLVVTHDPHVSEQVQRTVGIRDGRTSSEVRRRTAVDEHGAETVIAEEYAVLDRAGRLQLPHDFTTALAMRDLVRLDLEADHIGVWPTADGERDVTVATPGTGDTTTGETSAGRAAETGETGGTERRTR